MLKGSESDVNKQRARPCARSSANTDGKKMYGKKIRKYLDLFFAVHFLPSAFLRQPGACTFTAGFPGRLPQSGPEWAVAFFIGFLSRS
jgi:hypothetical protein